jgi:hypothetical protein
MTTADIERVRTARSNYCQQLEELSDPAKRKPTYSVGGRSVSWGEYHKMLLEMVRGTNELLQSVGDDLPDGGYLLTAAE